MRHSQNARILAYMKQGRSITALLALRLYGCLRLAARVYDLRQQGVKVKQRMIAINGKRVSVYWL
jgi:hypothetical protein